MAALVSLEILCRVRTSPVLDPPTRGAHIRAFALLLGSVAVYASHVSGAAATGATLVAIRATHSAETPASALKPRILAGAELDLAARRLGLLPPRLAAAPSLLCWVGVVRAGRWIGFA